MNDLYTLDEVAQIFDLSESRLRYWAQTDFLGPSERRGGRWYYRFDDLIQIRAAKELLDAGLSVQRVRKNLQALRQLTPRLARPASRMRVLSDGDTVVARDEDDILFEPLSGQLVMDFSVRSLCEEVADILALPTSMAPLDMQDEPIGILPLSARPRTPEHVPPSVERPSPDAASFRDAFCDPTIPLDPDIGEYRPVGDRAVDAYILGSTVQNDQMSSQPRPTSRQPPTEINPDDRGAANAIESEPDAFELPIEPENAYQLFLDGFEAEENGDLESAETLYRRAIERQPSLAAAHTNLGNLLYRRGDNAAARAAYERALAMEAAQPEARYNLANVLEDMGELQLAIAEMRRVCWTHPGFADAHYNLGLLLARTGQLEQARVHLGRYLELDQRSEWAERAREFLSALG